MFPIANRHASSLRLGPRIKHNTELVWETLSNLLRPSFLAAWAVVGFSTAQASTLSVPPPTPAGNWLTAGNDAVIQIAPCGANLCGEIAGTVITPRGAPMPKNWLGQPQCHEVIVRVSPPAENGGAWTGTVQDPRDGGTYHARLWLDGGRLHLRGYIGLPIFGQTQSWTLFTGAIPADCRMSPG